MNNMKKSIVSGVFWKFSERMAAQLVSVVVAIILARILAPSDYGVISLVTVFIALANVFVTDGFGSALIQKKNCDNKDFSTVFYFSIVFSIGLYVILFFASELVADFYNMPILSPVLKVLSLKVPIAAINSVQQAFVSRNMMFKRFFFATLIGTLISAVVGITMAYNGFGVWALVAQELTNTIIDTIVLWVTVKWRPERFFSFQKLKSLFSYGWKLLVQSLMVTLYGNLRSLIIGKVYTTNDLAYYTKGSYYPNLIIVNVDTAMSSALFPAMSKEQNNISGVKQMARRTTKLCSYVISPLLIGFAAVAESFVTIILTDKWLPIVPFIRIICVGLLMRAAQTTALQAIKSVGRSDIVLKIDIPVRIFGLISIFAALPFGVIYIAFSEIAVAIFGLAIYAVACSKTVGYKIHELLGDFIINVGEALLMGGLVWLTGYAMNGLPAIVTLLVQIIVGMVSYITITWLLKNENFHYLLNAVKSFLAKKKSNIEA